MLHSIILAGGSGTRLWPLSRRLYPKQFISLEAFQGKSLFQLTLERALLVSAPSEIRVVTNADYKFHCINQATELGIMLDESQILVEPVAKNTLAAIAFGMESLPNHTDIAVIMPSDQLIANQSVFAETMRRSILLAQSALVTFGIVPMSPHTGYGYIQRKDPKSDVSPVMTFREKPDSATAETYIREGFLWNAGIFMLEKGFFFSELAKYQPLYSDIFTSQNPVSRFNELPDLSIDYGMLEHSKSIMVASLDAGWNDLGSFDSLEESVSKKEPDANHVILEGEKNFIMTEKKNKVVSLVGVSDLIVIDTEDALLVVKKGESQKIKDVLKELKVRKLGLTEVGKTAYRPWGSYTVIDEDVGFKSKRLTVLPGKKLSLQMHYHRSEHWVVVSGTAIVTVGEEEKIVRKGESVFVPTGTKHRLENPGRTTLHLIESQIGDYLEEDDIVRFNDDFGRTEKK